MASLPQPDNRQYVGRGGSGKTTLALLHAAAFDRVILVRPNDAEASPYPATRDRASLVKAMLQPKFRACFIVDGQASEWEWANRAAWRAGDVVLIWEEAHALMQGRSLKAYAPVAFDLWMQGRHRRCRVFAVTMSPGGLSPDLRTNVARAVIFNTGAPADLRFYRDMTGDGALVDRIRALDYDAHEAVDWTPRGYSVKRAPFA